MFMETRNDLAAHFALEQFSVGAEVGVLDGTYSMMLCDANPSLKLFCIDSWRVHKGYKDYQRESTMNRSFENAKRNLEGYNCELVRKYSMEAIKDFENESLDFVYIDANHAFEYVMQDIIEWTKKVKKGGIVAGHDFTIEGVADAVRMYTKHTGRTFEVTKDYPSSWYFTK